MNKSKGKEANAQVKRKLIQFVQSQYKEQKSLLIGNGVNRINNGGSWDALLRQLCQPPRQSVTVNSTKSYPLTFEEILFKMSGDLDQNLKSLKEEIGTGLMNYNPFQDHIRLMQKKCTDILTTNYDYALERCVVSSYRGLISPGSGAEPKHSLFRQENFANKKIWHIHGELNNGFNGQSRFPELSIMIGNEHYADYLTLIHAYVREYFNRYDEGFTNAKDSWVKRFFTHDIDIVGLGFDFTENHLWWLLNYRARKIKEGIPFQNRIRYFYEAADENSLQDKLDLFTAFGIEPTRINTKGTKATRYRLFWDEYLTNH